MDRNRHFDVLLLKTPDHCPRRRLLKASAAASVLGLQKQVLASSRRWRRGHLVIIALHSNDCAQTVGRIVDAYPTDYQDQAHHPFALCLGWIINQRLLPCAGGTDCVLACSVRVTTTGAKLSSARAN